MNKTTFTKLLVSSFFLLINLFAVNGYAEGTPTLSPNAANITGLLSAPDISAGPYVAAAEDNRVKFFINNNATENFYFGFDMIFISKTHIQLYLYSNHRNKTTIERNY